MKKLAKSLRSAPDTRQLRLPLELKRDKNCHDCGLCETAEFVCLLGQGPKHPKAMVIGEAPGRREDESGKAFVGKAGELLDELLDDAGLPREDVYITNAVHCRPPENRTPKKKEIEACKRWIQAEIRAIKPKFILTLGNVPLQSLLGLKGIKRLRGMPIERDGITYFPTYHPSYALRDERQRPVIASDIAMFSRIVERGGVGNEEGLNFHIIKSWEDVERALRDIEDTSIKSVDTECSGLHQFDPGFAIQSIHIGTRKNQWCFPLSHKLGWMSDDPRGREKLMRRLVSVLRRGTVIMQNGKYDTIAIAVEYGLWLYTDFDTMLAHYNINENMRHDLKFLAQFYFEAIDYDVPIEVKQGKTGTLLQHCKYAALDIYYTRKLFFKFKKLLAQDKPTEFLFYNLTMPVARMYADIEYNGVWTDRAQLKVARDKYKRQAKEALDHLNKLVPDSRRWKDKKTKEWRTGVNWGSPKQIAEILFKRLGLKSLEKTKKGADSTNESVLLQLREKHKVPALILEWRGATKNLSFVDSWDKLAIDNVMHSNFKLHGTVTGRPSCEDPNLQQTPRNPVLRSCISAPPGYILVELDQSQVELRIVAELSQVPALVIAYQTGQDIHRKTVQDIFGIKDPTSDERKKGKAINFGFIYGMWWKKFIKYALDNYEQVFSPRQAQNIRSRFFQIYPLEKWHGKQKRFARINGYVRSLAGRLRRLPAAMARDDSPESKEAERQAINSPVQSFASDVTLMGALAMHGDYVHDPHHRGHRPGAFHQDLVRLCGTVHDAILSWVRKDYVKKMIPKAKKLMEIPPLFKDFHIKTSIPFVAEAKVGPWGIGKGWK